MLDAARKMEPKVGVNCLAHNGELLSKDLWSLFPEVEQRCKCIDSFFRKHYPRAVYMEELEAQRSRPRPHGENFAGGLLRKANDTRWGSKANLLQSIILNRVIIENSLARLRFVFNTLQFITAFVLIPEA